MTHPLNRLCPYCFFPLDKEVCTHCEERDQVPNDAGLLPVGYTLDDRYIIGSAVHSGSEAVVYNAYDTVGCIPLSLREYFPRALALRQPGGNILPKTGKEVQFKALRMDFEEVCRNLHHQRPEMCIIRCIDVMPYGDTVFGIFERPSGRKLENFLEKNGGCISWNEVKRPFLQLVGTIADFNRRGIIHRGVSTTTLHMDASGRLVLTGFGTSAFRTGHSEIEAEIFYGYAAPEQYTQRGWQGSWTDVYALGAVLYRILTGQRPIDYHGRLTGERLVPPEDFCPTIPHHVSDAIMKAMAIDVEERYQSADNFYAGLIDNASANTAVFDTPDSSRRRRSKGSGKIWIPGVLVAVIVMTLSAFLLWRMGIVPTNVPGGDIEPPDVDESRPASVESEPEPEPEPQTIYSPDIEGKSFEELLKDGDFISVYSLAEPIMVYSDDVPEGLIISQAPSPGVEIDESRRISLTVSLGPEYTTMPNVIGWGIDDAKEQLDILGIPYYDEVLQLVGDEYSPGVVVRTSIEAGLELSRRTQRVYLYTGRL